MGVARYAALGIRPCPLRRFFSGSAAAFAGVVAEGLDPGDPFAGVGVGVDEGDARDSLVGDVSRITEMEGLWGRCDQDS